MRVLLQDTRTVLKQTSLSGYLDLSSRLFPSRVVYPYRLHFAILLNHMTDIRNVQRSVYWLSVTSCNSAVALHSFVGPPLYPIAYRKSVARNQQESVPTHLVDMTI
jgi:hypothetical protein